MLFFISFYIFTHIKKKQLLQYILSYDLQNKQWIYLQNSQILKLKT
jgi:hypothetical protein